jgi:urease accessory protein UreF
MNAAIEQSLISRINTLSPQQVAEVVDFVEFLATRQAKQAAWDRLLAIAPALEAAGVEPMSMDEINAEVKAARAERRARLGS